MSELTAKQQKAKAKIANLQMQLDFYQNQLTPDADPKDQKQLEKKIAELSYEMERLRAYVIPKNQYSKADRLSAKLKKYRFSLALCLIIIIALIVVCVITVKNYSQLQIQYRSANYWSDYYQEEAEALNKKLEKLTGHETPTPSPKPTMEPENVPDNSDTQQEPSSDGSFYYVRKSANDKASQIGAFQILDNAKNLADEHKNDGYEVYDSQGKCVYNP